MEIGIDSFAAILPDPMTGRPPSGEERMADLLGEIELADEVGLDVFGVGEHHRKEFLDSAPAIILAAAAARTKTIRLTSAVIVLSAADPVRVFQEFATVDLISRGRAEIVAGRGSFAEAFPLFGFEALDYDALFAEKLDLLLKLREAPNLTWKGKFRASLTGQGVYPRPTQNQMPVWLGVGGTPQSFHRAGALGLPLAVAIIGGDFARFRPLIDLYRRTGLEAGYSAEQLKVAVHAMGFVAETSEQARDAFYPGWAYMVSTIGRERGWSTPSLQQFDATCGPGGAYLIGDPAYVAEKILEMNEVLGGVSRVTFQMSSASLETASMKRSIAFLGTKVAPAVRSVVSG